MKSLLLRWTCIALCSLAFITGTSATAQAGLIPWLYNAIFSPVPYGYGYQAGYAPMTAGYPSTSYMMPSYASYAPSFGACASACAPCAPCAGGIGVGGACVGGACGTSYTPGPINPIPATNEPPLADGPEPTYQPDSQSNGSSTDSTQPDEGFRSREDSTEPYDTGAFRQPTGPLGPETTIRQREAAPTSPMDDDQDGNGAANDTTGPILDHLVTWRVAPAVKRLPIRAQFDNPLVARRPLPVNQGWEPAAQGTRIVSK